MGNKRITNTAKAMISVWNIGLFCTVWFVYYNRFTFDRHRMAGGILSALIYTVIYLSLCSLYKAFRIASTSVQDTLFGQVISFGMADMILYVESCLIYNRYVDILPGAGTAFLQILGTEVIILNAKRYMMKHFVPKNTLLLYGKGADKKEAQLFAERLLSKYRHLFYINDIEYDRISEEELLELFKRNEVVMLYEVSEERRGHFIKLCTENHKNLYFTPRIEDILCQGAAVKSLLDTPLMKYEYRYDRMGGYMGKRLMDIILSFVFAVIASPIMLITALAIKLEDGGPVFFTQERYTKDQRIFKIIKFRSMIVDAEKDGVTPCTQGDSRITGVGKFIRSTRIDELPQLFNILKGDMSFVGPRPERVEHVRQYMKEMPEFAYRMRVKGGLTGYAQIYGKYNTTAYDKLRLDLMYIENQSLLLDLKIMLLTFKTIFQPESTEGFSEDKSMEMNMRSGAKVVHMEEPLMFGGDRVAK